MELFRVCPACGYENQASELMCAECMCFIGDVTPAPRQDSVEASPGEPCAEAGVCGGASQTSAAGTVKMSRLITLLDDSGEEAFTCEAGAVLGREAAGSAYLQDKPTVSRRHCQIDFGPEGWQVRDCGSMNGTWLNGVRINGPALVKDGDIILLSRGCALKVKL